MSKKRDKKILKMLKAQRTPKRIAGVRIPKTLRRWSDSQLGSVIIAQMAVNAGGAALASPAAAELRSQAEKVTRKVVESLGQASGGIAAAMNGAGKEKSKRVQERQH